MHKKNITAMQHVRDSSSRQQVCTFKVMQSMHLWDCKGLALTNVTWNEHESSLLHPLEMDHTVTLNS